MRRFVWVIPAELLPWWWGFQCVCASMALIVAQRFFEHRPKDDVGYFIFIATPGILIVVRWVVIVSRWVSRMARWARR